MAKTYKPLKKETSQVLVYMRPEEAKRIRLLAQRRGLPATVMLREIINTYIARNYTEDMGSNAKD
jgi:predicted DNA-binding protein